MAKKNKKQQTTEQTYTQVIPVVSCSDEAQVSKIMHLCGIPRALTYNKLGSLQGWSVHWKQSDPIIRTIMKPSDIGLPAKLWEWSVNDTMKAISAQQDAAKAAISRQIWQKHPMQSSQRQRIDWLAANKKAKKQEALELFPPCEIELERNRLLDLLRNDPTGDKWLHRKFRSQYLKGHTFVRNQVVFQGQAYTCKRINRHSIELQVQSLETGKRIALNLRSRYIVTGQIRLIRNEYGLLEVHCTRTRTLVLPEGKPTQKLGLDKGYTEGFYTSEGQVIAQGLGKLMTKKTERITRTNRNRYRMRCFAQNLKPHDPVKAARILENNLGHKVKSRKLQREKDTIRNFIRRDLRRNISSPVDIICEDLTQPIKGKQQAKRINRKLNQWMKGELQASLEKISLETGSTISVVNPAYTSQIDHQTGTLLGRREGDRFICYTGDVIQADLNAAINIRFRGQDKQITLYMRASEVQAVLIDRTVRYLASIGHSVATALDLGWLHSKFKTIAIQCEEKYHLQG
ncbi:zinc ribbon domain-containing protein [Aetokthonos hydrillicola Thurmond2011]|jgi:IS605 OrfB family transposase|uniref:Zinc ribbon domain-containing protein n=2 Tax=Aetokthonos TaxID=1550243 RepID=A0AAP5I8C2_9CYAN|nr:zinc ribbon domain-containing protein [Aetokthonos hydrillicola]MBO3459270.1 transposase [Aetokthonos hydrillicola CCALA 1050]MBW4590580.1 transposase [Aetokthonos hydrillicola CCALA 1050]MDR9894345.1 zinc ribbon domain-containing protein [Aetokthonos hydrillicola Thurmond2011]